MAGYKTRLHFLPLMWTYLFHLEGFLAFYGCFKATNTPKSNLIKCRIRSLDRPLLEKLYSSVSLTVTKYSSLYFHSLSVLFFFLFVSRSRTHRSQTQTSIGHSSMWTWSWGLQPCNLYPAWYRSLLLCVMLAVYSRASLDVWHQKSCPDTSWWNSDGVLQVGGHTETHW